MKRAMSFGFDTVSMKNIIDTGKLFPGLKSEGEA